MWLPQYLASLETWSFWTGIGAIVLPILGAVCGWLSFEMRGKIAASQGDQAPAAAAEAAPSSNEKATIEQLRREKDRQTRLAREAQQMREMDVVALQQVRKELEQANARLLELENIQKPRAISEEQLVVLSKLLKPTSKQPVQVMFDPSDSEQRTYAEALIDLLKSKHYVVETKEPDPKLLMPYPVGMTFVVNSAPPFPTNAINLQKSFDEVGIKQEWVARADTPRDVILLYVGTKP